MLDAFYLTIALREQNWKRTKRVTKAQSVLNKEALFSDIALKRIAI